MFYILFHVSQWFAAMHPPEELSLYSSYSLPVVIKLYLCPAQCFLKQFYHRTDSQSLQPGCYHGSVGDMLSL